MPCMMDHRGGFWAAAALAVALSLGAVIGGGACPAADSATVTDFMLKLDKLDEHDAAATYALGNWAEQHQLPSQASNLYRKVLKIKPDDEESYKRLVFLSD